MAKNLANNKLDYNKVWETVYGDIQRFGPTHKHLHRIYSAILKEIKYESVIDVGCGSGLNFSLLCKGKNVKELAGMDISSKCIHSLKEKYAGEFRVLDIEEFYLEKKYDLVFCSLIMEHVSNDEEVIKNLYHMTGKYLLIATIQGNYKKYERYEKIMGHVRNYLPGGLQEKLRKNGFRIKKVIEWGFPFYSPISRVLSNFNPNVGIAKYSLIERVIATLLYWLYFLNSLRKGDILVVLAEV